MKSPHGFWRRPLVWSLFYALVTLLLTVELWEPGRRLFRWDTLLYTWPIVLDARAQWLAGHIPFWSSAFCCGTPLLANINAGVLYPLRLLHTLLPLPLGYHLFLVVHVALALAGMHLLLRRLGRHPAACAVGALAFAAGGYARGMWDTHNFVSLPWIPLGLASLLLAKPGNAAVPLAALATGACWTMLLLGGDFQAAVLWVPAAALLAALLPQRRRLLTSLLIALALGALFAAPQWLPTVRATHESYRAGGVPFAEAVERSWHPLRLLEWFVPHLFGHHGAWLGDGLVAAAGLPPKPPWTASTHIGRLALGLALLGLWRHRFVRARAWASLVAVAGLLLSLGVYLPGFRAWLTLPVVGAFRYPEKYALWTGLGLAVLAAIGAQRLLAIYRAKRSARVTRFAVDWLAVLAIALVAGQMLVHHLAFTPSVADAWNHTLTLQAAVLLVLTLIGLWLAARLPWRRTAAVLVGLILADALLAWSLEHPTTRVFDPLQPPLSATTIRESSAPQGRLLRDPALQGAPMQVDPAQVNRDARLVLFWHAVLDYGSGRLWGLRSAGGFSPLESVAMRAFRLSTATPLGDVAPALPDLARFCRTAGVRWLLTTGARANALHAMGEPVEIAEQWGPDGAMTLLSYPEAAEAFCANVHAGGPQVLGVHRFRPGRLRVDLRPGADGVLVIRETWSAGWWVEDQAGRSLWAAQTPEGFMRIKLPPGTRQVRLTFLAPGWRSGLWLAALGAIGGVLLARRAGAVAGTWRARALAPAAGSVVLALVVGMAARGHWAPVFDEGFHLARGLALAGAGDSRFSYFHPPLQNLVCGGLVQQAFGDQLVMPRGAPWDAADVWRFAVRFADANRAIFPEMVRVARVGTSLFTVVLLAACTWWAYRLRGSGGAWLAGFGLALSPTLLAHGNLATTDMGVTACVVLGTALLWQAAGGDARDHWLVGATLAFVAAALTKFTGLIWLLSYLLIVLPLLSWTRRSWRPMVYVALGVCAFALLLGALYGLEPQEVRTGAAGFWGGRHVIAGRYLEGLVSQAQHSVSGQRAFFHGERLVACPWWVNAAQLVLKTPPLWCLAALAGLGAAAWSLRKGCASWRALIALIPLAAFTALWLGGNKLAIGVRHALPLVALGTLLAAVWAAGLQRRVWRRAACAALVAGSLAAAGAFPHYLSYYPMWAGGVRDGHRWMVDSNYDWGQDLEELESHWAELTDANGGKPPRLLYFGFCDPEAIYGMPVTEPSLGGFMERTAHWQEGPAAQAAWLKQIESAEGVTVASISVLELDPYGADLSRLRDATLLGRIGNSFRLLIGRE